MNNTIYLLPVISYLSFLYDALTTSFEMLDDIAAVEEVWVDVYIELFLLFDVHHGG